MATPPKLSDRQLKVYLALERNRMAWITFRLVMLMFVVVFTIVVYSIFWRPDIHWAVNGSLVVLDGLLGWSVRHIVGYLFSAP